MLKSELATYLNNQFDDIFYLFFHTAITDLHDSNYRQLIDHLSSIEDRIHNVVQTLEQYGHSI